MTLLLNEHRPVLTVLKKSQNADCRNLFACLAAYVTILSNFPPGLDFPPLNLPHNG